MIAMSEVDRARIVRMAADVARANTLPERIKAELRRGPATREELQAVLFEDMSESKRQILKSALRRMRIAGLVHEVPMQKWAGRRVQVAEVMVWTLAEHGRNAA